MQHGYVGEAPAVAQGDCEIASYQGTLDAQAMVNPKDGIQRMVRGLPGIPSDAQLAALTTCYMQGYNGSGTPFYRDSKGQTGLVVGGIAGGIVGLVVGYFVAKSL